MAPIDRMKEQGWNLSAEGAHKISENGMITDIKSLLRNALDLDLKEISSGTFPEDINKGKLENISGKIVVQIQKVRNISAPKANEESRGAPRMLKLSITDGITVCQALEVDNIPSLSLNTPPGTKLYLKGESLPMVHGIILLKPSLVDVLGGRVTSMIEKWELSRSLAKHTRGRIGEEGGPPPWIPFGQKILRANPQDRNFKSLESNKDKENRENAEFEAQRKDAIAEAAKEGGAKKVFGGGNKPLLDHNVQQIVDYGFTIEQAEHALRVTHNNVMSALRNLQRGNDWQPRDPVPRGDRDRPKVEEPPRRDDRRERRKRVERGEREEEGGAAPKPSAKVSLFDFLEDKLPVQNEKETESRSFGSNHLSGDRKYGDSYRVGNSSRGGRSDRGSYSQGQTRGARGGGAPRGRGHNSYNTNTRDDRYDRNRHGNSDRQAVSLYQQKPPRFQNQQRYQQQDKPPQQQQNWSSPSFSETNFSSSSHWNAQNPTSNSLKSRDEFPNSRDQSFAASSYDSRNRNARPQSDADKNRGRFENPGNGRNVTQNIDDLTTKLNSQHLSRDNYNGYQKSVNPIPSQNSMFPMDFGYKSGQVGSGFGGDYHSFGMGSENQSNQYIQESKAWVWHKGDKCMAKYWEDNMYYNAEVTGVSQRTCVVRFLEFGNHEEVLQDDCIPFTEDGLGHAAAQPCEGYYNTSDTIAQQQQNFNQSHFSGIVEFRRGGSRPFVKSATVKLARVNRNQQPMYLPPGQRK